MLSTRLEDTESNIFTFVWATLSTAWKRAIKHVSLQFSCWSEMQTSRAENHFQK